MRHWLRVGSDLWFALSYGFRASRMMQLLGVERITLKPRAADRYADGVGHLLGVRGLWHGGIEVPSERCAVSTRVELRQGQSTHRLHLNAEALHLLGNMYGAQTYVTALEPHLGEVMISCITYLPTGMSPTGIDGRGMATCRYRSSDQVALAVAKALEEAERISLYRALGFVVEDRGTCELNEGIATAGRPS